MSEKKQQNVFVPLRVRFRSPAKQAESKNEHPSPIPSTYSSTMPDDTQDSLIVPLPRGTESAQRTQQIKELIRLCNVLRAELGLMKSSNKSLLRSVLILDFDQLPLT